jgi:hypothetical protein
MILMLKLNRVSDIKSNGLSAAICSRDPSAAMTVEDES